MKKLRGLFSVLTMATLGSCNLSNSPLENFEYIPFEEYKYNNVNIPEGTEVELLAFSGGEEDDKNKIYYYQFLVLNKATGDTFGF